MAEALASNIGGAADDVGDPKNIIIASRADLTFTDFLVHALSRSLAGFLILNACHVPQGRLSKPVDRGPRRHDGPRRLAGGDRGPRSSSSVTASYTWESS